MTGTDDDPPRKVALFSGHMIDAPDRAKPRFPADKEPIAARAGDGYRFAYRKRPAAGEPDAIRPSAEPRSRGDAIGRN
jgi:hypothetical protein